MGAWAGLATGDGSGSAEGNNTLGTTFQFVATTDASLSFEFDIRSYLSVFASADEQAGGLANATTSFSFQITDLSDDSIVLFSQPTILNAPLQQILPPNVSGLDRELNWQYTSGTVSSLCFGLTNANCSAGSTYAGAVLTLGPLVSGRSYQLDAFESVAINIERAEIPAPGTLLLFGLGVLGLGAARLRKNAS